MGGRRSQHPGALIHTRITWALSPMAPQVPGVTPGSPLCPWCCGHSSRRGARQSRAASPSVPLTAIMASLPSKLQHTLGLCTIPSPNRPLTRSVANRRGISHTLLMARAVPYNSDVAPTCLRSFSEIVRNNMDFGTRSFPSSSTIEECGLVSAIGIATRTRTAARIAMPSTLPSTNAVRIGVGQLNSPSSLPRAISHSDAPLEPPRLRTTRGAKR